MKKVTATIAEEVRAWLGSEAVLTLMEETEKATDGSGGTFEVVITTENVDRYQEVIKLDGWELEHYLKNPVVLWAHDHKQPIGMATSLEIVDGKMVAKGKFAPTEHAQEIRKLYDFGIIKATSVGFIEKEREGNLITKAELLEFSFVSVPANPYALSLAMKSGLNINEMVTKGILELKEVEAPVEEEAPAVPETEVEAVPADPAPVDPANDGQVQAATDQIPPEADGKGFNTKAVATAIDQAKAFITALEALVEEPERREAPVADPEEEALRKFTDARKLFQDAATAVGGILADMRQEAEAKR